MNHVKHHKVPASLLHRQDSLGFNGLLTSPKVLYCEKCGFASTQTEEFENHMREHLTPFYCFYCNHVSYSKKELEVHLLQHKYPFRCHHCGQGYMRRPHLLNHIDRLHGKDVNPEFNNAQATLPETFSLSTAFAPGVHRTNVPTVKVRIPAPVARNDHANKSRQRRKTDLSVLNAPKVNPELISPVKNFVHHNMALTVPLPEEVSIPAGCMVELIEVKTVNGTKELKLRLVSQQENTSVLDDTVLQHSASVNPLSSALSHRNLLGSAEKSSVNSKRYTAKNVDVERPATFQTIVDKTTLNALYGGVSGTKRTLQESMIRNMEIPYTLPTKVPRITDYPTRQAMAGPITQTETLKPKTDHPTPIITGKTAKKITSAANRASKGALSSCKTPQGENNPVVERLRIPSELQVAVKEEPNDSGNNTMATPEIKEEPLKQNDQTGLNTTSPPISSSVSTTAHTSRTTPTFSECKKKLTMDSTILMTMLKRPGSVLIDPVSTKQTKVEDCLSLQKSSIWSESETGGNRPFEPFPVISSVFSLSQQQDEVQSSIQPLLKALRGIVMKKDSPSVQVSTDRTETTGAVTEHKEEFLTTINGTQEDKKDKDVTGKGLLTQESCDVVKSQSSEKCSQQTQTQAQKYYIKEETSCTTRKDSNQKSPIPTTQHEPLTVQQEACINNTLNDYPIAGDGHRQTPQSASKKEDGSSKFLTVSLERIHMDLWKPSKKSPKLSKTKTPPIQGLCHEAFLYPAPLKVGQPVVRPGPNQPVVVLNHPKPTVPKRTAVDHLAEPQVTSEVLPRCQILKMRLSKVIGEKYEVIGCTVGLFS